MNTRFEARLSGDEKTIRVYAPPKFKLNIKIDHDDVDHKKVEKQTEILCKILNENWPEL